MGLFTSGFNAQPGLFTERWFAQKQTPLLTFIHHHTLPHLEQSPGHSLSNNRKKVMAGGITNTSPTSAPTKVARGTSLTPAFPTFLSDSQKIVDAQRTVTGDKPGKPSAEHSPCETSYSDFPHNNLQQQTFSFQQISTLRSIKMKQLPMATWA